MLEFLGNSSLQGERIIIEIDNWSAAVISLERGDRVSAVFPPIQSN